MENKLSRKLVLFEELIVNTRTYL